MNKIILTGAICSIISITAGYFIGSAEKQRAEELIYCSIYKVYTDGVLYALESSDIDKASEAKSRLVSELQTTNEELERCVKMELDISEIVEISNKKASEFLHSL